MTEKELATLYAYKDINALNKILTELKQKKDDIDAWFTEFGKKHSNSVLSKAKYDSPIRKPYNDKFDEYEQLMKQFRLCNYYMEILR